MIQELDYRKKANLLVTILTFSIVISLLFVGFLILFNVPNIFGPLMDDSELGLAITALTAYFLFAAAAFWLDTKRS